MAKVSLSGVVRFCDRVLQIDKIPDYDGAMNGLQVQNRGVVTRVAAAVDATLATINLAAGSGADLLLVHHGLFWGPAQPWTGRRYQLLQALLESNLAVYSAHLPLDAHPRLGNNAGLCVALGLRQLRPFFLHKGHEIGFQARTRIPRNELARRLEQAAGGRVHVLPGGPPLCRKVGVVTGGAGSQLTTAASEGVDTFITGEGPHWTFAQAMDLGLNVLYGGHYATETFGVQALARELNKRFGLPWKFIDYPTGL